MRGRGGGNTVGISWYTQSRYIANSQRVYGRRDGSIRNRQPAGGQSLGRAAAHLPWTAVTWCSPLSIGLQMTAGRAAGLGSAGHPVVAEDLVQGGLIVRAALGQPLQHQHARHSELAAGELARPGAAHADRPGGHLAAGQFVAGLDIDHVRGPGQDGARAEHGTLADPGAFDDHAPGADVRVVLDDHRDGVRRLEHAADTDPAGQVHVLADLSAGSDRRPGVDHRPGVDIGTDVDERGHQDRAGRDVGTPPDDGARDRAHAVEVRGERDPVVIPEVAHLRPDHRQQAEGQQDRAFGPFVDHDLATGRIRPRHPGLPGVDRINRGDHDRPGLLVVRGKAGARFPQFVDPGRQPGGRPGGVAGGGDVGSLAGTC